MISDALKEIAGVLDRRFLMFVFVPSLFFWAMLMALWFAGQGDLFATLRWWNAQEALPKAIEIAGFLGWVYVFSIVLGGQSLSILRFFEGYWSFPGAESLKTIGTDWHKKILRELEATMQRDDEEGKKTSEAYEKMYDYYPPTYGDFSEVMPTRIGNILKGSELYASDRYQIDSVLIWPRLHKLFPAAFVEEIALLRGGLDSMLIITTLGLVFAVVAGSYLLIVRADWWLFLLSFWGGLILAWIAYRSALSNAVLYGLHIKIAFDLYRNELLKQMRLKLPRTQAKEKEIWDKLGQFLYSKNPIGLPYTDPAPSSDRE
jgi:hypothetical protein